jgi:hypothetical protein
MDEEGIGRLSKSVALIVSVLRWRNKSSAHIEWRDWCDDSDWERAESFILTVRPPGPLTEVGSASRRYEAQWQLLSRSDVCVADRPKNRRPCTQSEPQLRRWFTGLSRLNHLRRRQ